MLHNLMNIPLNFIPLTCRCQYTIIFLPEPSRLKLQLVFVKPINCFQTWKKDMADKSARWRIVFDLQESQVSVLSQLLQVLHGRAGLDEPHQSRRAVQRELSQQGLLIVQQQQCVIRPAGGTPWQHYLLFKLHSGLNSKCTWSCIKSRQDYV